MKSLLYALLAFTATGGPFYWIAGICRGWGWAWPIEDLTADVRSLFHRLRSL